MTYGLLTNEKSLWGSPLERNNLGIYHGPTNIHCALLLCQSYHAIKERERSSFVTEAALKLFISVGFYVTLLVRGRNESD